FESCGQGLTLPGRDVVPAELREWRSARPRSHKRQRGDGPWTPGCRLPGRSRLGRRFSCRFEKGIPLRHSIDQASKPAVSRGGLLLLAGHFVIRAAGPKLDFTFLAHDTAADRQRLAIRRKTKRLNPLLHRLQGTTFLGGYRVPEPYLGRRVIGKGT